LAEMQVDLRIELPITPGLSLEMGTYLDHFQGMPGAGR
jgi:hypothetical protein